MEKNAVEKEWERLFEVAAGIDVHRDTVVVSVRRLQPGGRHKVETRTFETFHDSLVKMAGWLAEEGVQVVGLESTGVYWQPVVRALQQYAPAALLWLVNPAHVRKVPGRKTDVTDSQWLSKLVMYGLVAPSFLPSAELQELRKLTRHRTKVVADRTRHSNRIIKELEAGGIKLASVCSDVLGKTGRAILDALIENRPVTEEAIAEMAHRQLRKKTAQLVRAVDGTMTPCTRVILKQMLERLDDLAADVASLDAQILQRLSSMACEVALLNEIPGFDSVATAAVLAEMGPDISVFPSAAHLTSWAGLSPGSEESAGKPKKVPTRKGDKYLRTILVQIALAASRTKGSYWQRKYRQLVHLGPKKAIVALARKLLAIVYKILKDRVPYRDPASVPLPPHRVQATLRRLSAQIEALGYQANLTPKTATSTAQLSVS